MEKKKLQIDVLRQVPETELMECNVWINNHIYKFFTHKQTYEELIKEEFFVRDGKESDSAGVMNTTNTFIEK